MLPPLDQTAGYIYHCGNNYTQKNIMPNPKSIGINSNTHNNTTNSNGNKNLLIFKPWSGTVPVEINEEPNQLLGSKKTNSTEF